MATTQVPTPAPPEAPRQERRAGLLEYLTTVDHNKIGVLYLYTAFGVFFAGGILAMLVRAEPAEPGLQCGDRHDPDMGRPIAAPLERCAELLGVDPAPSASWRPTSSQTSAPTAPGSGASCS